jgi:outer membrane protein assembly factor BamA
VTRTILLILISIALALPGAAQQEPVARFLIEKIEVRENSRVSSEVIVAESRLREGHEYSEEELSDAAARLNRLPFLLSADFALERGSERGRHVLVITVNETKPFFYLLDIQPILTGSTGSGQIDLHFGDRLGSGENQGVLGARWFVGRRGAFHTGLFGRDDNHEFTRDYTAAVFGYTQYDILGTRAFVTLNLKKPLLNAPSTDRISPQVVVGIPVSPNQTVTLTYDETNFDDEIEFIRDVEVEEQDGERLISARWSFDTTNDPFTPTRGTLLSVTPIAVWEDSASHTFREVAPGELSVVPIAFHSTSYGISVDVAHYFELSEQGSIFLAAEAGKGRVNLRGNTPDGREINDGTSFAIAQAGYSRSLWSREEQKRGDSRFEYTLRYINRDRSGRFFDPFDDDELQVAFAWVRRSSFGTIRLGVGYGW